MPASVTVATVNNTPAGSGHGSQTHVIYAVNGALWWAFWLDSTDTTLLRCASSPDLVTWTARTSATVTSQGGSEGRNFSVAYANISSTDVVHIAHAATNSTSQNLRGTMSGTTITWSADNSEGSTPGASPDGTGSAIATDGTPFASNTSSGNLIGIKATNADTGASWTTGWGAPATVFSTAAFAGSTALVPVASAHILYLGDNGSSNKTWNNLRYSLYTSSFAASAAVRGSNLGTAQNPADWGWAKLSNTDVHVMMRTGSNTFEHFRWNGTSFSAGDTVDVLATAGGQGIALSTDGTNVWAFTIASASGNDVYYNKWTSGTGWGGWTALGLGSATRTKIGACQAVSNNQIPVYFTAGTGTPFTFEAYNFSTAATVTSDRSIAAQIAVTTTSLTRSIAARVAVYDTLSRSVAAQVAVKVVGLSRSVQAQISVTDELSRMIAAQVAIYETLSRLVSARIAIRETLSRAVAAQIQIAGRRRFIAAQIGLFSKHQRAVKAQVAISIPIRRIAAQVAVKTTKSRMVAAQMAIDRNRRYIRAFVALRAGAPYEMPRVDVVPAAQPFPVPEEPPELGPPSKEDVQ